LPANGIQNRPGSPINRPPSWSQIDRGSIGNINNKWNNAISDRANWGNQYGPGREDRWNQWGDNVRNNWDGDFNFNQEIDIDNDFDFDVDDIDGDFDGWHYGWGGVYVDDDDDWWVAPAFGALAGFVVGGVTSAALYPDPIIYDYGTGGNVYYEDNSVYIGGQEVATAEEFAESAADLATVEPPATDEELAATEWMPLGRFLVTTDPAETDPSRVIELAVDKQGIISGTLWNAQTQQGALVQGQVDKATQRVAFRVGNNEEVVAETGLYNLTLDEAPVLVHFGPDKTQEVLLVRLPPPEETGAEEMSSDPSAPANS
jgi:hypothetical protein